MTGQTDVRVFICDRQGTKRDRDIRFDRPALRSRRRMRSVPMDRAKASTTSQTRRTLKRSDVEGEVVRKM